MSHCCVKCVVETHQRRFTQQLAASHQVSDGDVEVGVATAPVGDLGEGVGGQDVLQKTARRTDTGALSPTKKH